jgi:hypothetical protein
MEGMVAAEQTPQRQMKKQRSQVEEQAPQDTPLEARMPETILSVCRENHAYWAAETQRSLARFASIREKYYHSSSRRPWSPTDPSRPWSPSGTFRPTTDRLRAPLRIVETLVEMKVRQSHELNSRFVRKLPAGVRLKVFESRVTSEGGERICVALNEQEEGGAAEPTGMPTGWVTARRKRLCESLVRDVTSVVPASAASAAAAAAALSAARSAAASSSIPIGPGSSRPMDSAWPPSLAELTQRARFVERSRQAMEERRRALSEQVNAASLEELRRRTRSTSAAAGTRKDGSLPARVRPPSASSATAGGGSGANPRRPASADNLPGTRRRTGTTAAAAAALAAKRKEKETVMAEVLKPQVLMTAAELAQVTNSLKQRAAEEDQRLHHPRPIDLRVGAALRARASHATDKLKFFGDLFLEWDPNRDGGVCSRAQQRCAHVPSNTHASSAASLSHRRPSMPLCPHP